MRGSCKPGSVLASPKDCSFEAIEAPKDCSALPAARCEGDQQLTPRMGTCMLDGCRLMWSLTNCDEGVQSCENGRVPLQTGHCADGACTVTVSETCEEKNICDEAKAGYRKHEAVCDGDHCKKTFVACNSDEVCHEGACIPDPCKDDICPDLFLCSDNHITAYQRNCQPEGNRATCVKGDALETIGCTAISQDALCDNNQFTGKQGSCTDGEVQGLNACALTSTTATVDCNQPPAPRCDDHNLITASAGTCTPTGCDLTCSIKACTAQKGSCQSGNVSGLNACNYEATGKSQDCSLLPDDFCDGTTRVTYKSGRCTLYGCQPETGRLENDEACMGPIPCKGPGDCKADETCSQGYCQSTKIQGLKLTHPYGFKDAQHLNSLEVDSGCFAEGMTLLLDGVTTAHTASLLENGHCQISFTLPGNDQDEIAITLTNAFNQSADITYHQIRIEPDALADSIEQATATDLPITGKLCAEGASTDDLLAQLTQPQHHAQWATCSSSETSTYDATITAGDEEGCVEFSAIPDADFLQARDIGTAVSVHFEVLLDEQSESDPKEAIFTISNAPRISHSCNGPQSIVTTTCTLTQCDGYDCKAQTGSCGTEEICHETEPGPSGEQLGAACIPGCSVEEDHCETDSICRAANLVDADGRLSHDQTACLPGYRLNAELTECPAGYYQSADLCLPGCDEARACDGDLNCNFRTHQCDKSIKCDEDPDCCGEGEEDCDLI